MIPATVTLPFWQEGIVRMEITVSIMESRVAIGDEIRREKRCSSSRFGVV